MENQVLADELICAVCLELYQDPVALACQHSFCAKCISDSWDHSESPNGVSCPQCRMTFNPRPKLVKNHTLNNIVEKYNQRQPTAAAPSAPVMCEYCIETPVPAVKTCLKCETSFCSLHLQPHLKKLIYKDHSLIEPVADLTKRQCPTHKKVLEFYCEEDVQCVCMLCSVIGNHKSHTLLTLEQARDKIKEELQRKVENLRRYQNDWTSEQENLKQQEIKIKSGIKELKETLSTEFSKWRKQLEDDETSALKLIDEEEKRVLSEIKGCWDSLVEKVKEIQIIEKEVQDQNQKDPLSFIQDAKQLLSRCSQLDFDLLSSGVPVGPSSNRAGYVNPIRVLNTPARNVYSHYPSSYGNIAYPVSNRQSYADTNPTINQTPRISSSWNITINLSNISGVIENKMVGYQKYQRAIMEIINKTSCQLTSSQTNFQMAHVTHRFW